MNNSRGFSLIEVMLASSVLLIGVMVVMSSLSASFTVNLVTEEQTAVITGITTEIEILKSLDLPGLQARFGPALDQPFYFAVSGLKAAPGVIPIPPNPAGPWDPPFETGREPALGGIIILVPNPPGNPGSLVEAVITIAYTSTIGGPEQKQYHVWLSPDF